jgi:hypothetical protein
MPEKEITRLRRKRVRIHRALDRLEPLIAGYRAKLARVEARIQEIAPELPLSGRRRSPDPHFARGELTRLALDVMRQASEPMRIRDIAAAALRRKGLYPPSRTLLCRTVHRLQGTFAVLGKRGVVEKVGEGKETRRCLNGPIR